MNPPGNKGGNQIPIEGCHFSHTVFDLDQIPWGHDRQRGAPVSVVVEPVADLLLDRAEPRAAGGVPLVLGAVARGQELLREGHAHLGRRAGVAEADGGCRVDRGSAVNVTGWLHGI